jgi:SAM-dependent methyltransferase
MLEFFGEEATGKLVRFGEALQKWHARFVADLGAPVVDLLAPRAGERILDLGCGDGVLTAKLASMGCHVIGVDASAPQIEAARKLGLDARVMNGEALNFDGDFDAVFSNAALHWMSNPAKVIAGVRRALKPHGRFVAEFGGRGCVAKIRKALIEALNRRRINGEAASPWYFPTVEEYSQQLMRGGFVASCIALIPEEIEQAAEAGQKNAAGEESYAA